MKIFYAGVRYDHYDQKRGLSFEHNNFYLSLASYPDATVRYFEFDRILEVGKQKFYEELLHAAKEEKPDVVLFFMYSDELNKETLKELKKYTTTIAWFADDSWRFYSYSKFWAKHFTWAVTTYSWMPELYRKAGQPNIIRSQWAANTSVYEPQPRAEAPAVSFVGGKTGFRQSIVAKLKARGIAVAAFGGGWGGGRISDETMLSLFSNSKINLGLNPPPGMWTRNAIGRLLLQPSITSIVPNFHIIGNIQTFLHQNIRQIKARHFEIPACGGFVITQMADDLGSFYKIGEEIVVYEDDRDLAAKIRYYLAHEDERARIAKAAYARTVRDHTYEKRFSDIFKTIGF
jgi:spore maturation protein CgeB